MYSDKDSKNLQQETTQLLNDKHRQVHSFEEADLALIKIEALHRVLKYHDWLYYVKAEPIIKDTDYDYLFDWLKELEENYSQYVSPDSPTQRVAAGLSSDFPTVEHTVPMLSLAKAYDNEDLKSWEESLQKVLEKQEVETNELEYIVEPKFDGSSIALIYEDDMLVRGATRGNGIAGDDISNNIKTIPSIPLSAKFSDFGIYKAEVRGEVVIHKERFEEINRLREERGDKLLANPRNSAAGALRQKDPSKVMERKLEAFIYQLGAAYDKEGNDVLADKHKHGETILMLYQLGFKTALESADDTSNVCKSIDKAIAYCDKWRTKREDYPYEIDGMVVKLNDLDLHFLAGATAHHPRWAIALKFDARQAETILESVDFQVGRTGVLTPVARLQTVNVAGANISNVSLHNEDFIRDKELKIGDTVIVERAGDVIPYIKEAIPEKRTGAETDIVFPAQCPSCGSPTSKPEDESFWRCENAADCPAQVEERIIHYVSKGAMDIRGLGKDIVRRFYKEGLLKGIAGIYKLDYDTIGQMEGWGERSVENLQQSIEQSKQQPLHRLIKAIGIREVGTTMAKTLVGAVGSIEEIKTLSEEQLIELPDVGPKVAHNIIRFFQSPKNLDLIAQLKAAGVNTLRLESEVPATGGKFEGQTFLFTGTLTRFKRSEAQKMVEEVGGKNISAVSKKLNYLVVGENAGSKLTKAQKTGTVQILTEDEFLEMISG